MKINEWIFRPFLKTTCVKIDSIARINVLAVILRVGFTKKRGLKPRFLSDVRVN